MTFSPPRWRSLSHPCRTAEAILEQPPVARRQNARRLFSEDRDAGEEGTLGPLDAARKIGERGFVGDVERRLDTAGSRDADEVHRAVGMARLPAGLGITSVVEHGGPPV